MFPPFFLVPLSSPSHFPLVCVSVPLRACVVCWRTVVWLACWEVGNKSVPGDIYWGMTSYSGVEFHFTTSPPHQASARSPA